MNGTALSPCYTLEQLVQDEILPLSPSGVYNTSVELVLLPGIHVIPEHQTFSISNYSELTVRPLNEDIKVECEPNVLFIFLDIAELKISSLHFIYCFMKCVYT